MSYFNLKDFSYSKIFKDIEPFIVRHMNKIEKQDVSGIKLLERTESKLSILILTDTITLYIMELTFDNLAEWEIDNLSCRIRLDSCIPFSSDISLLFGNDTKSKNSYVINTFISAKSFITRENKDTL